MFRYVVSDWCTVNGFSALVSQAAVRLGEDTVSQALRQAALPSFPYIRVKYSGSTVLIILVNLVALVSASVPYWPKDTDKNWNQGFMVFHCSKQVRLHRQEYCLPRMPFGWKGNGAQLFSTRWSPPPRADERKALPDMPPCFFDTLLLCQCARCVTDCIMPRPAPPPWWPPAKILT